MAFVHALQAVLLGLIVCDVTSANGFFGAPRFGPNPTCDWEAKPSLIKELQWAEKAELCFDPYNYPQAAAEAALRDDLQAQQFLNYSLACYGYQNQKYYEPYNQQYYYQDLCPVRPRRVNMVWMHSKIDRERRQCYIIRPEQQRVMMAQCGEGTAHPDSQKCKLDKRSYFEGNFFCVPDGYVQRTVLVYCPWSVERQCMQAKVRIPTGCSCKRYTCDKKRQAMALGGGFDLSALAARLAG